MLDAPRPDSDTSQNLSLSEQNYKTHAPAPLTPEPSVGLYYRRTMLLGGRLLPPLPPVGLTVGNHSFTHQTCARQPRNQPSVPPLTPTLKLQAVGKAIQNQQPMINGAWMISNLEKSYMEDLICKEEI